MHSLDGHGSEVAALVARAAASAEAVDKSAYSGGRGALWQSSPGMTACRNGDLATLRSLMDRGTFNPITEKDKNGSTGLLWAASANQVGVVQFLVGAHGVDPLTTTIKDGRNALHWAARYAAEDVCRWLIHDGGVDPDLGTGRDGSTAAQLACYAGSVRVAALITSRCAVPLRDVRNDCGCSAAHFACLGGSLEVTRWLFDTVGVKFDERQNDGVTAFHKACVKGHKDVVEFLVSRLSPEAMRMEDFGGFTAEALARGSGHAAVADMVKSAVDRAASPPR